MVAPAPFNPQCFQIDKNSGRPRYGQWQAIWESLVFRLRVVYMKLSQAAVDREPQDFHATQVGSANRWWISLLSTTHFMTIWEEPFYSPAIILTIIAIITTNTIYSVSYGQFKLCKRIAFLVHGIPTKWIMFLFSFTPSFQATISRGVDGFHFVWQHSLSVSGVIFWC